MLQFRAYRCPGSNFASAVATAPAYVAVFEDGAPIGRIWAITRDAQNQIVEMPACIDVLWPTNKGLAVIPTALECLPRCRIADVGDYGDNVVTLPDGRQFRLPLASGGYLTSDAGELPPVGAPLGREYFSRAGEEL